jgi:PKHD-type hydroxylase
MKINNTIMIPYLSYPELFSSEECDLIIKTLEDNYIQSNTTIKNLELNNDIRKTKAFSLNGKVEIESEIERRIKEVANMFNNKYYQFDLDGSTDKIQYLDYTKGGHYDWHPDVGTESFSRRKLTAVVQLTNPKDYEGGELEFFNFEKDDALKQQGTIIIFSAFTYHKVNPIISGKRNSLVTWFNGEPFK